MPTSGLRATWLTWFVKMLSVYVSDGLRNLAIGQAPGADTPEVRVADFAALHQDASREFQNRVGSRGAVALARMAFAIFFRESPTLPPINVCALKQ